MTHNQIEYWKLVETRRHNLVSEGVSQHQADSQRISAGAAATSAAAAYKNAETNAWTAERNYELNSAYQAFNIENETRKTEYQGWQADAALTSAGARWAESQVKEQQWQFEQGHKVYTLLRDLLK